MGSNANNSRNLERKGKVRPPWEGPYGPKNHKKKATVHKKREHKSDNEEGKEDLKVFQQLEQLEQLERIHQTGTEKEEELEYIRQNFDSEISEEGTFDQEESDLDEIGLLGKIYQSSLDSNISETVLVEDMNDSAEKKGVELIGFEGEKIWIDLGGKSKRNSSKNDVQKTETEDMEELECIRQNMEGRLNEEIPEEEANDSEESDLELIGLLGKDYLSSVGKKVQNISERAQQAMEEVVPYEYGKKLMFEYRLRYMDGRLCMFEGKFWKYLDDDTLRQLAYESLEESIKSATKNIESLVTNIAHYVKREILKSFNDGTNRFTEKEEQTIENRIVFENCVVDVRTGKKLPFTHKLPYSYMVSCDYIEEDKQTPYYDQFKYDATGGDPDSMEMFDLMQAYLLIPNRKGKCFFIMAYAKDSGKTSFGEFIEKYFPEGAAQKVDVERLGDKFSYAGMERALLVSCLEMPVMRLTKSAVKALKNFTGESRIEIEAKYRNRITANVRFKILLGSNGGLYLPPGDSDEAFYRRAIIVPFIHSTPLDQLIADMPQRWEKERPAIISKCVRKLGRLISEDGGIVFPESELSKEIKYGWQGKSIVNEKFVREAIVFTARSGDAIPKEDLKAEYDRYCSDHVSGTGMAGPMQCTKDELVKIIFMVYPHAGSRKLRRETLEDRESRLRYCITGVEWADGFGDKRKGCAERPM